MGRDLCELRARVFLDIVYSWREALILGASYGWGDRSPLPPGGLRPVRTPLPGQDSEWL
jgi:hypothetical protein